ncbi:MAG: hypothetical protein RLZ47_15 [Bacteroidota bacterium]|jgi:hypothetical protein
MSHLTTEFYRCFFENEKKIKFTLAAPLSAQSRQSGKPLQSGLFFKGLSHLELVER